MAIFAANRASPELLRQLKQTCLEAYANQDVPFERIVKELRAGGRGLGRNPLFQVAFVLQNAPMPDVELSGLSISGMEVDTETTPFDMVLSVSEGEEILFVGFLYSTDLFKADRVRRMARHYEQVLRAITANIEAPVWKIRLLSASGRARAGGDVEPDRRVNFRERAALQSSLSCRSCSVVMRRRLLMGRRG